MLMAFLRKQLMVFFLPFAIILLVFFMARSRIEWLRGIPMWTVFLTCALVFLIWTAFVVVKARRERKQAEAMEAGLLDQAHTSVENATPRDREELQKIQKELAAALATLRSGPDGKRTLYSIPWYMIIGPPACGKTTACRNSGLPFPGMTEAKMMEGTGGTRNCTWWLSTEAIILDTAGRWSTSEEGDADWFGFLDLLKRHRRHGPVNGLILSYSMEDMIRNDEVQVVEDARRLRQRVDEMTERLGWNFPIYILFMKCDLVSGFADFFSSLSPIERQRDWGRLYPVREMADQEAAPRFEESFKEMVGQLRSVRARQVASVERRPEVWGRAFMFPEEMAALRDKLRLFMDTAFEPNPFRKDHPILRGTYFCSGKQEGVPLDMVVSRIEAILGGQGAGRLAEMQPDKEDAYFVRDVFAKVLKPDRELVRRTHAEGKRLNQLRIGFSAASVVFSALFCVWICTSCIRLEDRMRGTKNVAVDLEQIRQPSRDVVLEKLDQLHGEINASWKAFPLVVANKVRDAARGVYERTSRDEILIPIEKDIEGSARRRSGIYDTRLALRSELLFVMPREQKRIGTDEDLAEGLARFGFPRLDLSPGSQRQLKIISRDFLEKGEILVGQEDRDAALRRLASRLDDLHAPHILMDEIVAEASERTADLTLRDLSGGEILSSSRVIRSAFTQEVWRDFVGDEIELIEDDLKADNELIELAGGTATQASEIREDLLDMYRERTVAEWSDFLRSVRLPTYAGCSQAGEDFSDLSKSRGSPLLLLLRSASEQCDFGSGLGVNGGLLQATALKELLSDMQPLVELSQAPEDGLAPIEEYREELDDICDAVVACSEEVNYPRPSAKLRNARRWVEEYVDEYGGSEMARATGAILHLPVTAADAVFDQDFRRQVEGRWQDDVLSIWRRIENAYPFKTGASSTARVEDVMELLGPQGKLAGFDTYLESHGLEAGEAVARSMRELRRIGAGLSVAPDGLSARFKVWTEPRICGRPQLRSDGSAEGERYKEQVSSVLLAVGDQKLDGKISAPRKDKEFRWTSDDASTVTLDAYLNRVSTWKIEESGSAWSLFRLIDRAEVSRDGSTYCLTWRFPSGIEVEFGLEMQEGVECPFVPGSKFRNFRLPSTVLQ